MKTLEERFWEKVELIPFHSCWEWTRADYGGGYGYFSHPNGGSYAHRFSFWFFLKKHPGKLMVCHKCDNKKCVNP